VAGTEITEIETEVVIEVGPVMMTEIKEVEEATVATKMTMAALQHKPKTVKIALVSTTL
jgi:hypothetical protein